jgi:hypothetical protein
MSKFDYNVNNYTVTELLEIIGADELTSEEIKNKTQYYINRFSQKTEYRPETVSFFQSIQTKLLQYLNKLQTTGEDKEYDPDDTQTQEWIRYQSLPQEDPIQKDKNTDRNQKIDIYDNGHLPMKREQLGVNNTFQVPVAQDNLNPNLENTTSRFIVLDSQFRQSSGGSETMSTDFTMDLSEPLTDVISLRLYSIQIPYTWYTIDYIYGNTCFWVTNSQNTFKIFIEPGNYSPTTFCNAINNAFTNIIYFQPPYTNTLQQTPGPSWTQAFTYIGTSVQPPIATFNESNGKITLNLNNWQDPNTQNIVSITQYNDTFNSELNAYYTFFDITGTKTCNDSGSCVNPTNTFDSSLGWLMGFRLPIEPVFSAGNVSQTVLNLYRTKYFIIVLDDFNQNRINNGLITITELSKSLPIPSYFNNTQPFICTPNATNISLNIDAIGNLLNTNLTDVNIENIYNSIQDKIDVGVTNVQQVLPSAPRTLTQAQIYTVNEIIKNRSKTTSFRTKAPTNSDTFAIIPIKYGSMTTGQIYSELSGQFQDNKRIYFGPVDIDRLRIKLLDDRGNTVNLHGADWSVTMISENLYQY